MSNHKLNAQRQSGGALILMAFILGLGAAAYILKVYNADATKAKQDEKTYQVLAEAKLALIAWAVSHPNHPGIMPFPDRNDDPMGYDDRSDCVTVGVAGSHLIGRLPLLSDVNCVSPQIGVSIDGRDATGERLWYSVSINLVRMSDASATPVINPSIVNSPSQPWFVVRDRSGAIISNRVAAVIIAPNQPVGTQDRAGGIAATNQYLDKIVMADGTPYQNYGYQDPATNPVQEFIIGDDFRVVNKNDPTYKNQTIEPYYYNDKLVYITIDELMYAIEKRVLEESKNALSKYYATNSYFPFAAGLGSTTNQNQCTQGSLRGLLPVNAPTAHTCTCTALSRTCNCNFGVVSTIAFTRSTGTFVTTGGGANAPTGACSVQLSDPTTCTCNGAGSCKRASGATQFSCDACGNCTATIAGANKFVTTGIFSTSTGVCSNTASSADCPSTADGTFTLGACNANEIVKSQPAVGGLLPAWFMANGWEKYIVYALSSDCNSTGTCLATTSPPKITVGLNQDVNAIVASSVVNPANSCNIANYLSSTENTNKVVSNGIQDNLYQKTQAKTQLNTDQLVVVP